MGALQVKASRERRQASGHALMAAALTKVQILSSAWLGSSCFGIRQILFRLSQPG
jgi:hypothetical protein